MGASGRAGLKRLAVPAVAALLLAPSCGLGDKQAQADRIHAARQRALTARAAAGTLTFELIPPEDDAPANPGISALERAAVAPPLAPATITYRVDFDFAHGRSRVSPAAQDDGDVPPAAVLFDRDTIFVRRVNLRPSERRSWAKLDFGRLPEGERRPPVPEDDLQEALLLSTHALNPVHVIDLAGGALAGSVEVRGREEVAGIATTVYDVNVSLERAIEQLDLDDEDLETRRLMLRLLMGANDDVRPGSFWVDDDGLLRKARFELRQRVTRRESNDLIVTLEIPQYGVEVEIPTPAPDETIEVERYGRVVRAAIPRSG